MAFTSSLSWPLVKVRVTGQSKQRACGGHVARSASKWAAFNSFNYQTNLIISLIYILTLF
jgi:hypothetical protein